jgi:hypothetical protein
MHPFGYGFLVVEKWSPSPICCSSTITNTNSNHASFKVSLVDNTFVGISYEGACLEVLISRYVFVQSCWNGGRLGYLTPTCFEELTTNFTRGTSSCVMRPYIMCKNDFGEKVAIEEH